MPLITSTTKLNKLKFGVPPSTDRKNGGNSNEPYITKKIPGVNYNNPDQTFEQVQQRFFFNTFSLGNLASNSPDFIIRGGALSLTRSATDVSRLTQMFFDFKSPAGALFVAKQNLLSRTGVKLQAGDTIENLTPKERLQALQELASTAFTNGLGDVGARERNRINPLNEGTYTPLSTLLAAGGNAFGAHPNKQGIDPTGLTALSRITYSDLVKSNQSYTINRLYALYNNKITNTKDQNPGILFTYKGGPGSELGVGETVINRVSTTQLSGVGTSYEDDKGKFATLSQTELQQQTISRGETKIQDFRAIKRKSLGANAIKNHDSSGALAKSLDYSNPDNRIETRLNLGEPDHPLINRSDYSIPGHRRGAGVDKINNMYLYRSEYVTTNKEKNDLVKFRIAVIDPDEPKKKTFIHFRSYIKGITDNFNADWSEFKYLGRGEKFFNYQGFDRTLSLSWTVFAQSKPELSTMYQKLNYLASTLAPNFGEAGFMRGNIHQLTIGGYVYEYPGIITSLTYTTPDDSTWEIAVPIERTAENQDPDTPGIAEDVNIKELAHRIEVQMTFKPINDFLPQTVKDINGAGSINERFLSLTSDSGKTNSLYNKGTALAIHPTLSDPIEEKAARETREKNHREAKEVLQETSAPPEVRGSGRAQSLRAARLRGKVNKLSRKFFNITF